MSTIPPNVDACRQQNALQRINRLPPELLIIIFSMTEHYYNRHISYGWLRLLHVCTHWHDVAIVSGLFRSTISIMGEMECVQEMLRRSGSSLLDVYIENVDNRDAIQIKPGRRSYAIADEILRQMHRIKSLLVRIDDRHWQPANLVVAPAMLQRLELDTFADDGAFDASSHWPFSVPLPSLRELRLSLNRKFLGVPRAPNLRVLHISLDEDVECGYMAKDLFETMRQMPLLEDVRLNWIFHFPSSDELEGADGLRSVTTLHLPRLKFLEINDRGTTPSRVLDLMTIPADVSLKVSSEFWTSEEVAETVSSLRRKLCATSPHGSPEHRSIRTLSIQTTSAGCSRSFRCLTFEACPHIHKCLCFDSNECQSSSIHLDMIYDNHDSGYRWTGMDGFTGILDLLQLQEVEVLHVKGRDVYNALKQRLGLLDLPKVPFAEAPLTGVHHFDIPSHSGGTATELEPRILQLFTNLKVLCLDLSPEYEDFMLGWNLTEMTSDDEMDVDDV